MLSVTEVTITQVGFLITVTKPRTAAICVSEESIRLSTKNTIVVLIWQLQLVALLDHLQSPGLVLVNSGVLVALLVVLLTVPSLVGVVQETLSVQELLVQVDLAQAD